VLLTGINYTLVESLKSELVARMDAQEATLQASIDTQTTTLGADIASLEASSTSEDERLRQSFATLSSEVNATIAKGLKNRNDAIRTALIGQLSSEQYYTVKAVNVPLDLLRTKEWKAVYGKLGTPRLYPFKDRVAFEVDVVDLDSPKGLALQELASFAFHPEIQFAVELKYGIPKLR